MSGYEPISWSFGLRNSAGLYLTAEAFGFRINCTSKIMKKKQIFFLEQNGKDAFIKTHLGRYLTFKEDGKFLADAEAPGADEAIAIEAQLDGRWALKTARGYFAGGIGESLDAFTKELKADRLWTVQLAMHPQVCIRNVNRKRYVHLSGDKLACDEDIPWGADAMITICFFDDGKYALQANDGRFLSETSELKGRVDESCKFTLDFVQQMVAFRSSTNKYVTALGAEGVLKATKPGPKEGAPTVDELFVLEDSQPQFKLKSQPIPTETKIIPAMFASVKRGIEVQCCQSTTEDTEIFQFEINPATKQWSLRTNKGLFWSCRPDGSIQAIAEPAKRGPTEWFKVHWMESKLALQASNGNFVTVKKNGGCFAISPSIANESTFTFEIINRPNLVLRGEHGFVGTMPSGNLECNRSTPEVFSMHVSAGFCQIQGSNGKFWRVGPTGVAVNADEPDLFTMEFVEHSKFVIRAPNGSYLQGQQNGSFTATGKAVDASTLWEF